MPTVLLVDDDPLVRAHLKAILEESDYRVLAADSAEQALSHYEHALPDVVVADYYMPEKTGGDLLRTLRTSGDKVPFVALTASEAATTAVELFTDGADDYLTKPVRPEALLFRLSKVMEARRAREAARKIEVELIELERRQLVSWRKLYATKEARQTSQIIELLTRAINQDGGFLWVELLQEYLGNGSEESYELPRELLSMILEAGKSQKEVFDYVTFISTIDSLPLEVTEVPLSDLVGRQKEQCRSFLAPLAEKHPREFAVLAAGTLPRGFVSVDESYLQMILEELMVNAVKYSPENSRIVVDFGTQANSYGTYLLINVENKAKACSKRGEDGDCIVGIPYEQSELVFDLFYTLDAYSTTIPEERWKDGTGLYIARRILTRFGAAIDVANGLDYTSEIPQPIVRVAVRLPITQEVPNE